MKRDTTLTWGAKSNRLVDLVAFRDRLVIYCATARAKQNEIRVYALMLPDLEKELLNVSDQIVQKKRKQRRRKAA